MNVKDCFDKRLLRKISSDENKKEASIRISESKFQKAKELYESEFYSESLLSIYTSLFHISRALLYKKGIQEKSHYAVYVYLKEKYSQEIEKELLNFYNQLRENRHEILYGFEEDISKEEAEEALVSAENFINEIKNILNKQ